MVLVCQGPGISAGQVKSEMVSFLDLTPTILDWAGVAKPAAMVGRSVQDILDADPPAWRDGVLMHTFPSEGETDTTAIPHYSYITDDWKLTHFYYQGSGTPHEWELIDLTNDPNEETNLYGQDPATQFLLKNEMEVLREEWGMDNWMDTWLGTRGSGLLP
jgi:arylsulfatase A-like enzyme